MRKLILVLFSCVIAMQVFAGPESRAAFNTKAALCKSWQLSGDALSEVCLNYYLKGVWNPEGNPYHTHGSSEPIIEITIQTPSQTSVQTQEQSRIHPPREVTHAEWFMLTVLFMAETFDGVEWQRANGRLRSFAYMGQSYDEDIKRLAQDVSDILIQVEPGTRITSNLHHDLLEYLNNEVRTLLFSKQITDHNFVPLWIMYTEFSTRLTQY